jgi:hypothetical protein
MKQFIDALRYKVHDWRTQDYPRIHDESRNILKYATTSRYLRRPQIEALETYIYLKEVMGNRPLKAVVPELLSREEIIEGLNLSPQQMKDLLLGKLDLASLLTSDADEEDYPNHVFALTMGS